MWHQKCILPAIAVVKQAIYKLGAEILQNQDINYRETIRGLATRGLENSTVPVQPIGIGIEGTYW